MLSKNYELAIRHARTPPLLTLDEINQLGFVIADSTFHSFEQVAYDTLAILSNPTISQTLTRGVLSILEFRTGMDVDKVRSDVSIVDTPTPVLLIHALNDPAMSVSHSHVVFDARTNENVSLEITDWGAGHADSALINATAYKHLIFSFLAGQEFTHRLIPQ